MRSASLPLRRLRIAVIHFSMVSNWDGLLYDPVHANRCAGNRAPPRSRRDGIFTIWGFTKASCGLDGPSGTLVLDALRKFDNRRLVTTAIPFPALGFLPFPPSFHGLRRSCPNPGPAALLDANPQLHKPWGFLFFLRLVFFCCFFGLSLPSANFPALAHGNIDLGQVLRLHMGQGSRQLKEVEGSAMVWEGMAVGC